MKYYLCVLVCCCLAQTVWVKDVVAEASHQDAQILDVQLADLIAEAHQAVVDAHLLASQIIARAEQEAETIQRQLAALQTRDQDALSVQSGKVNVELQASTVEEIATAIMPLNWRIMVDVIDARLLQRRFQFISSKPREQVLNDLLRPLDLQHHYFFDLNDDQGNHSPLLVISQRF